VAEWSKALAWKVSNILKGVRGFESLPLRHPRYEPTTTMSLWRLAFASSRRLATNPVRPGREQR
jgi:hypothetical protein